MSSVRERLLARAKVPTPVEPVQAGDWGTVHVRGLTGAEYDEYERACVVEVGRKKEARANRAVLVRMCVCDEAGALIFKPGDEAELGGLPAGIVNPIVNAAMRLSGVTGDPKAD